MARDFPNNAANYLSLNSSPVGTAPILCTAAIRFKADTTTTFHALWAAINSVTPGHFLRFFILPTSGLARFATNDTTSAEVATTTNSITAGVWSNVVARVRAANDRDIILNGDLASKGTNTATKNMTGLDTELVGRVNLTDSDTYDGSAADLAVWNVALSDNEALAYHAGISPLRIRRANLVQWCPILGFSPETDYSGNGNALTINGTLTVADHVPLGPLFGWDQGLPYVVAGGQEFNDSVAETLSAADTLDSALVKADAVGESVSAADTVDGARVTDAAVAESVSAADSLDATASVNVAVAESVSAADTQTALRETPRAIAESGSTADTQAAILDAVVDVQEAASAADALTGITVKDVAVNESISAVDTTDAVQVQTAAVAETASAIDAPSAQLDAVAAIAESGSAADAPSAILEAGVEIQEIGSAADTTDGVAGSTGEVSESGSAVDAPSVIADLNAIQAETAAAADTVAAAQTSARAVEETGSAVDATNGQVQAQVFNESVAEVLSAADSLVAQVDFAALCEEIAAAVDTHFANSIFNTGVDETGSAIDALEAIEGLLFPPDFTKATHAELSRHYAQAVITRHSTEAEVVYQHTVAELKNV